MLWHTLKLWDEHTQTTSGKALIIGFCSTHTHIFSGWPIMFKKASYAVILSASVYPVRWHFCSCPQTLCDIMPAFRAFSLLTEPTNSPSPDSKLIVTIVESHEYNLFLNTNSFYKDNLNWMALLRLIPDFFINRPWKWTWNTRIWYYEGF